MPTFKSISLADKDEDEKEEINRNAFRDNPDKQLSGYKAQDYDKSTGILKREDEDSKDKTDGIDPTERPPKPMSYDRELSTFARYNAFSRNGLEKDASVEKERLKEIFPSIANPLVHSDMVRKNAETAKNKDHSYPWNPIPTKDQNPLPITNPLGDRD